MTTGSVRTLCVDAAVAVDAADTNVADVAVDDSVVVEESSSQQQKTLDAVAEALETTISTENDILADEPAVVVESVEGSGEGSDDAVSVEAVETVGELEEDYDGFIQFRRVNEHRDELLKDFDVAHACNTVIQLDKRGYHNSTSIIHALVQELIAQEKILDAVELVKMWVEKRAPIYSKTYTLILSELLKRQIHRKVEGAVKDYLSFTVHMQRHNVPSDKHQYYQILKMGAHIGNVELAQTCYDKIIASGAMEGREFNDRARFVSMTMLNSFLLKAYNIEGRNNGYKHGDKVLVYLKEILDAGELPPDKITFQETLQYMVQSDLVDEVRAIMEGSSAIEEDDDMLKYLDNGLIKKLVIEGSLDAARAVIENSQFQQDCRKFFEFCLRKR